MGQNRLATQLIIPDVYYSLRTLLFTFIYLIDLCQPLDLQLSHVNKKTTPATCIGTFRLLATSA